LILRDFFSDYDQGHRVEIMSEWTITK